MDNPAFETKREETMAQEEISSQKAEVHIRDGQIFPYPLTFILRGNGIWDLKLTR